MSVTSQQKLYEGVRIDRSITSLIYMKAGLDGDITEIDIYCSVLLQSAIFNVRVNGVQQFSGGGRPTITAIGTHVELSGLSIAVVEGDSITLDIESCPAGGVASPITFIVHIDDGISSGGGSSRILYSDDFQDGTVDSEWTDGGAGILTESSGLLHITYNTNGYARTQTPFLTGTGNKSIEARIAGTPAVGSSDFQGISLGDGGSNNAYLTTRNNHISLYIDAIASWITLIASFNISIHSYLRVALVGNTIIAQVSPDGINWTTYYTYQPAFDWANSTSMNGYLRLFSSGATQTADFASAAVRDLSNF